MKTKTQLFVKHPELIDIFEGEGLKLKYTLNRCEYYYSDYFEDGYVFYDIDEERFKIINNDDQTLLILEKDVINEYTVSQYFIEYIGK